MNINVCLYSQSNIFCFNVLQKPQQPHYNRHERVLITVEVNAWRYKKMFHFWLRFLLLTSSLARPIHFQRFFSAEKRFILTIKIIN